MRSPRGGARCGSYRDAVTTRASSTLQEAVVGVLAGAATLATAFLLAAVTHLSNPVVAVGSLLIDLAPPGVKTVVIALFGTGDKLFLIVLLGVVILALSVVVGILQLRREPLGLLLLLIVAFIATLASATRAGATVLSIVPPVAGAIVGCLVLRAAARRLTTWRATQAPEAPAGRAGLARRSFLQYSGLTAAASIAGLVVGGVVSGAGTAASAVRRAIQLPAPASPAPPVPAAADLAIDGLTPYLVPNGQFYRIDTALVVPTVDAEKWSLRITGMVENEVTITFAELLALPLQERIITLTCVSQEIGGDLIGNARWLGYPIRELLARARPTAGADMVLSTSVDGFTAGTPLQVLQDPARDSLLAVGMNGQPLPLEHGFPVRMVVPGLYGYVSATKWVVELKVTTFAKDQGYWTPRGWSALGPVKLSSRIDTPTNGISVSAGRVVVAGVAWAQHTGISRVQLRVDDGPWQDAALAELVTVDSWLQWSYVWQATAGQHRLTVRATDANGLVQTAAYADPAPNGSTGLHSITVQVA
nr:molybdopterin-dependent oxidoreductase [Galbitalea soli]